MPEFTLDCKHPEPEVDESYIEEDYDGRTYRVVRYYCPTCGEMFERYGPNRSWAEP